MQFAHRQTCITQHFACLIKLAFLLIVDLQLLIFSLNALTACRVLRTELNALLTASIFKATFKEFAMTHFLEWVIDLLGLAITVFFMWLFGFLSIALIQIIIFPLGIFLLIVSIVLAAFVNTDAWTMWFILTSLLAFIAIPYASDSEDTYLIKVKKKALN